MTARMVNRLDGKWHIEITPSESPDSEEGPFFLALGGRKDRLAVRMIGGLMLVEVKDQNDTI